MHELDLFEQSAQVIQDSHVDRMRAFAATKHQNDGKPARQTEVLVRCLTVPKRKVRAERVSGLVHFFVKERLRLLGSHRDDVGKAGDGLQRDTGLNVRHIKKRWNRAPCKRHWRSHITTSKE